MSPERYMRLALTLAQRAYGETSPNPMVGAVLVKKGGIIGQGWHHHAGLPHAEIEALADAKRHGKDPRGATLFVTLEPCSTYGRTPPCTQAVISAGIRQVVTGATDPNPAHAGRGLEILRAAGILVKSGVLETECADLNAAFNHWIVHRTPLVTVKAAMTLDGKIATASGESKWITGEKARAYGMRLRTGADAILVGISTILADDPSLTWRPARSEGKTHKGAVKRLQRFILDSQARTPLGAKVISDAERELTTIIVTKSAPALRITALRKRANVLIAPGKNLKIDLQWVLKYLGKRNITSLLVEGGGEVNASFLLKGLAQRVAFFYAPKILGGRNSRPAVAGTGAVALDQTCSLTNVKWQHLGPDLLMTAEIDS